LLYIHNNYVFTFTKTSFFLSKTYVKNRASLGFLFFTGTNYLGHYFSILLYGNYRTRMQRKVNIITYLDYLFDDFYSGFNVVLTDLKNSYFYDLNFFSSNLYLAKLLTFNY